MLGGMEPEEQTQKEDTRRSRLCPCLDNDYDPSGAFCNHLAQGAFRHTPLSISMGYAEHIRQEARDHSQFACCNQTVTTINKWRATMKTDALEPEFYERVVNFYDF